MFSDELRQKHPCFKKGRSDFQFYNHVKADPYRKKLGQPQNILGLNLTNKFVLFIVYFFAVTFAECSLGDGLILLVFYLLTKLVLFLGNENMVGLTYCTKQ